MKRLLNLFKKKEEPIVVDLEGEYTHPGLVPPVLIPRTNTKPAAVNPYDTNLQRVLLGKDIAETQRQLDIEQAERQRTLAMIGSSAYCPPPASLFPQTQDDVPEFADVDDINEFTVITIHNKGEQQNVRLGDLIIAMKKINTMNNANK